VRFVQVSDWFEQVGDAYLSKKDLGSSLAMANALRDEQIHFERQARVSVLIFSAFFLLRSNGREPGLGSESSTGPFCVTRSDPTRQLTDPTQPTNPLTQ